VSEPQLDLQSELARRGALLSGHFRLSSGRHSDRFIQKFRVLEDPTLLEPVARAIAGRFAGAMPTVVIGAAIGGILIAYEVARQLGTKAIFVERENGLPVLRRGFTLTAADRALVVEDVVTTGLSVGEVLEVVRNHGARTIGVAAIVARGAEPFDFAGEDGVPAHALLEVPMMSYDPAECPQCRRGEPLSDPGSRRA
jgi:orotate phosphoribosyltransferase